MKGISNRQKLIVKPRESVEKYVLSARQNVERFERNPPQGGQKTGGRLQKADSRMVKRKDKRRKVVSRKR